MPILSNFVSEIHNVIYFSCQQLKKNKKEGFKKSNVITFSYFFDYCTAKNKDSALKY